MESISNGNFHTTFDSYIDVENDVVDTDAAAAWSNLQIKEGAVDWQENQSSDVNVAKEPLLEGYTLPQNVKVEPLTMTMIADQSNQIDLSAFQFTKENVVNTENHPYTIDFSCVENVVNTENQPYTIDISCVENVVNTENHPYTIDFSCVENVVNTENQPYTIDFSCVENVVNTENYPYTIDFSCVESVANTEDPPSTIYFSCVENVVNPPEPTLDIEENILPLSQPIFEEEEMELLNLLELESEGRNKKPKLVDAKDLHAYPKAVVQCAICDEKFSAKSFKFHHCDVDETSGSSATKNIEIKDINLDTIFYHSNRLMRENQIRMNQFFKCELQYDLKNKINGNCNEKIDFNSSQNQTAESMETDADATESAKKRHCLHECTLCERKFVHASGLLRHMEKHDLDVGPLLSRSVPTNEEHGKLLQAVLTCTLCGRIFFDPQEAFSHYNDHIQDEEKAPSIWESYEPNNKYGLHLKDAMQSITYNREETELLVKPGMESVTIMTAFQCEFCDFLFIEVSFLLRHSAQHVPDRPFECFSCELSMHSFKEISAHWQVECVFRRELFKRQNINALCYLVCNICEQKFLSHEQLIEHRYTEYHFFPRMNKLLGELQLPCEYCRLVFTCAADIIEHYEQSHHAKERQNSVSTFEERPYLCEICGKTYTQSSHLWQHLRFHQGVKPFICKEPGCERKFTIRPDLNDHVRKCHTGDRPYLCVVCNKRFLTGSVYYQHRLIHRKERRFECGKCAKRFYRADALKNHQRIHTGEKPFDCPYCTKNFRQRGDCEKHVRARHGHLNADDLRLLQIQKWRLEAVLKAAGVPSADKAPKVEETANKSESPKKKHIEQDDNQDENQKDKKKDLVVDEQDYVEEPLIVDMEHNVEEPLIVDMEHDVEEPLIVDMKHDVEEPLIVDMEHDVEEPLIVDMEHDVEEPLIVDMKHDVEELLIVDIEHDVEEQGKPMCLSLPVLE